MDFWKYFAKAQKYYQVYTIWKYYLIHNSRHHSSFSSSQTSSFELVKYLKTEFYTENPYKLDILEWLKNKQGCFPTLSLIARDILATLVSIVASENEFSASNHVLNDRRSTMSSDILEGLLCFKRLGGCKKAKTKQ